MESQQYPLVPQDATPAFHDAVHPHGLHLRRVVRHRWSAGVLVFAILAPALVGMAWMSFQPQYVAEAVVQVNTMRPKVLYRTEDTPGTTFNMFFNTQLVTLTSTTLLNRCLNEPSISNSQIVAGAQDPVQALREALQVSIIPNTQYLAVKVRGEKPNGLAAVANTVVQTYLAFLDEADGRSQNKKIQLLDAERKKLAMDIEMKATALAQSRASLASNPDASSGSLIRDPLSVTHEALVGLRKDQASLKAKIEFLQAALKEKGTDTPPSVIEAATDREPEVEPLAGILAQLRREIVLAEFEAASPLVASVQARLNAEPQINALKLEIARRELHVAKLSQERVTNPAEADGGQQESTPAILTELLADDPEGLRLAGLAAQLQQELLLLRASGGAPSSATVRERLDAQPQVQALKGEMMRKEVDLATKAETLRQTHPGLVSASAILDGLRSRLAKAEAELKGKVVEELKLDAQQREKELGDQLRAVEEQLKPFRGRALTRAKDVLAALRERLATLEPELKSKVVQEIKKDAGRRAKELQEQLSSIQKQLRERRELARAGVTTRLQEEANSGMARRVKELESELGACVTSENALRSMLTKQLEQRVVGERKAVELKDLEDDMARTRQSLFGVDQRLHELEVEAGAPGYVSIASMATDPKFPEPYMPKRIKYGVVGLIGAAGLALLVMILLDRQDDRIRCPDDLQVLPGVDLLGCVPHWGLEVRAAGAPVLLYQPGAIAPRLVMEEIRKLVARLLCPPDGQPVHTVLVTGAAPGDGRTTLAVNVASCIASVGRKVLLVDASFRKPDVAGLFGSGAAPGLGEVLSHRTRLSDAIRETAIPCLSVLPAGVPPEDTVGALGSDTMQNVLAELGERYDYVLVDGPPLMLADARILAPMVDAVICALRAIGSRRSAASECLTTLRRLGARVLGLVLMGVRPEHNGYAATAAALHNYAGAARRMQIAYEVAATVSKTEPPKEN